MTGSLIALIGLISFYFGYAIYSKYISKKIFEIEEDIITPSIKYNDGSDYVPTNKHILFGHHFTSIAGLAPILGPCIAVCWGWLPALIWIIIGTIFTIIPAMFLLIIQIEGNHWACFYGPYLELVIKC